MRFSADPYDWYLLKSPKVSQDQKRSIVEKKSASDAIQLGDVVYIYHKGR